MDAIMCCSSQITWIQYNLCVHHTFQSVLSSTTAKSFLKTSCYQYDWNTEYLGYQFGPKRDSDLLPCIIMVPCYSSQHLD